MFGNSSHLPFLEREREPYLDVGLRGFLIARSARPEADMAITTSFVERHALSTGYDEDRLREALDAIRERGIEHVLVEACATGRASAGSKSIAAHTFADAVRHGVPFQSGVLSLDLAGDFAAGTGYDFELGGQCSCFPGPGEPVPEPRGRGTALVMADPYLLDGRPAAGAPRPHSGASRRLNAARDEPAGAGSSSSTPSAAARTGSSSRPRRTRRR